MNRLGAALPAGHNIERMGFLSQLRYPTAWYSKMVIAILALAFFGFLAAAAISGYVVYRIAMPARSHSEIDLQNFPGHPLVMSYSVPGEGQRDGWFFPGLKSAPSVILCPGLRIEPRRAAHAGFGPAGSSVQRAAH